MIRKSREDEETKKKRLLDTVESLSKMYDLTLTYKHVEVSRIYNDNPVIPGFQTG